MGNLREKYIRANQIEIQELKNMKAEIKKIWNEISSRLDITEEAMYLVTKQSKSSKMRHREKKNKFTMIWRTVSNGLTLVIIVFDREKRQNKEEKNWWRNFGWKFSKFGLKQWTTGPRISVRDRTKTIPRHIWNPKVKRKS